MQKAIAADHDKDHEASEQGEIPQIELPKLGMRVVWPWCAQQSHKGLVYAMREVEAYHHASVAFDDCTFGEWALGPEFQKSWGNDGTGVLCLNAPVCAFCVIIVNMGRALGTSVLGVIRMYVFSDSTALCVAQVTLRKMNLPLKDVF